jgi:transposase
MTTKNNNKVLELTEGEGNRKNGNVMGIDCGKKYLSVCILSSDEILYENPKILNTRKDIVETIIKVAKKYQIVSAAMEATSIYHFKLMFAFVDFNIPHLVADPKQTKETQGKKTDKLDGRRIAVAHRDGRLKPSVLPSKDLSQLRYCTRRLSKFTNEQTKSKQRIHHIFHLHDFNDQSLIQDLLSTQWGLKLLADILTNGLIGKPVNPLPSAQTTKRIYMSC